LNIACRKAGFHPEESDMVTKLLPVVLTGTLFLAGCSGTPTGSSGRPKESAESTHHDAHESADEAKIRANLA
jgi:hypothetical protein